MSGTPSFSGFIDHYILLSMARYNATAEAYELDKWTQVSESVQYLLRGPTTAEERKEVDLVDASHFTPKVCQQRALYLLWQTEKKKQSHPTSQSAAGVQFDITKHSIKYDVERIFEAVRHRLPSTIIEEEEEEEVHYTELEPTDYLKVVELDREQFNLTEEELAKQKETNLAKDLFLSKVQKMQVEFYQNHRRWVEVPERYLEMPTSSSDGGVPSVDRAVEEEKQYLLKVLNQERESPESGSLNGNKAVLNALKHSLHDDHRRPTRPSKMTDEDIENLYKASSPSFFTPNAKVPKTDLNETTNSSAPMHTPVSMSRDTTPQTLTRRNRWQIVEYDDDDDNDDGNSSSSSEEEAD